MVCIAVKYCITVGLFTSIAADNDETLTIRLELTAHCCNNICI